MARRRRHKQADRPKHHTFHQRVAFDPIEALSSMLVRPFRPALDFVEALQSPLEILDFDPPAARLRPGRSGFSLSPVASPRGTSTSSTQNPSYTAAGVVQACVSRHQRREVLHAFKLTGKGSRARRRRRTAYSGVSC